MQLLDKLKGIWTGLSATKKSVILIGIACLLLSSFLFYRWATKVEYAPLFTNVQTESAGKIVESLKSLNIPYTLSDGGSTIMVPSDQVYELRLELASKGIMSEGSGFELFDTTNIGTTDFERNVNYQRALQEELRRTIVQIDAVKQARVHLVLPEKSAFIENEHNPQASIVLELKPMAELKPEQVKGIAELVAGSVENLKVEDVNIIDTEGNVLSDVIKNDGNTALQMNQLELQRDYEKNLEKRVQQMLDRIYGSNKTVAMITANLDFNQKEVNRTVWGNEGVVRSEQNNEKRSSSGDSSSPVGELNRNNVVATSGQNSSDLETSSTKNYEINKVEEKEIYAPGRVKSISTAVAINGDLDAGTEKRIKDIISAAIGFDAERGDTLKVLSTAFDESDLDAAREEMAKQEAEENRQAKIDKWMSWGLKGVGIIVLLVLGIALIRHLKSKREEEEYTFDQPEPLQKVEEQLAQKEMQDAITSEDKELMRILKDQPEVAAQIINTWLEENESGSNG